MMAKKAGAKETGPRICRDCENWDEVSKRVRVNELLEQTLRQFEKKIQNDKYEPTVAEYVKLVQLGQELKEDDDPKEIKVTWVGPDAMSETDK